MHISKTFEYGDETLKLETDKETDFRTVEQFYAYGTTFTVEIERDSANRTYTISIQKVK